jgi:hypothetical protein
MSNESRKSGLDSDRLLSIAEQFNSEGRIVEIREFGSGRVNDTFLVCTVFPDKRFILQRINERVFNRPDLIMQNLRILSEHISKFLLNNQQSGRRWEMPRILPTAEGGDLWSDSGGHIWRAMSFIDDAASFESIMGLDHASEVGFALGSFHTMVGGLSSQVLSDTLEGFHITPLCLRRYLSVLEKGKVSASADVAYCMDFIEKRKNFAYILEDAKADGRLPSRIIHGDPKVSNVMIDVRTGLAVSIVDLDTVKPGLLLYDIGDCLRSCCNPLGEDPGESEKVRFEPEFCRALLKGYFGGPAKGLCTAAECEFIYDSIRLLSFELGLRFFTDYLEGDVYFKVSDPRHNLRRALTQFRLTESVESQAGALRSIIKEAKNQN